MEPKFARPPPFDPITTRNFALFRIEEDGYHFIENYDAGKGPPYFEPGPKDAVNVVQDTEFVELKPGESYSQSLSLYPDEDFVEDFELGKRYAYRFLGESLEWWSWGRKEDFRNKPVLENSISRAFSPSLVVPASNYIELEVCK
ncbi:MAG: hypothetical protein Q9157_006422 [Trypethelium eluteriae]